MAVEGTICSPPVLLVSISLLTHKQDYVEQSQKHPGLEMPEVFLQAPMSLCNKNYSASIMIPSVRHLSSSGQGPAVN